MTETRCPGKLILCGEHAVLYGTPALATAIDCHATVKLHPISVDAVDISLPSYPISVHKRADLRSVRKEIEQRHHLFLEGELAADQVVTDPMQLLAAALDLAGLGHGCQLHIESDIPLGSGMGSSAAVLAACVLAVNPSWSKKRLFDCTLHAEHWQHGRSSGLDPQVCIEGGVWWRDGSQATLLNPSLPDFEIWFTGQPASPTSACVEHVRIHHAGDKGLWNAFTEVSLTTRNAIESQPAVWAEAIRENQALLSRIGVVPPRISTLITDIETDGLAAKVCGAGSVEGDSAGAILVRGKLDAALARKYSLTRVCSRPSIAGAEVLRPH